MNLFKDAVFENLVGHPRHRRFLPLLGGSIAVAVLVGFIFVTYSEAAALLP